MEAREHPLCMVQAERQRPGMRSAVPAHPAMAEINSRLGEWEEESEGNMDGWMDPTTNSQSMFTTELSMC